MFELSVERVDQILHQETPKKEELATILRGIYTRYMRMYEKYFADIDALDDDVIADLKKHNEETKDLIKYYYMDIPQDVCTGIREFENKYSSNLLGSEWHEYLFGSYEEFKEKIRDKDKSEESLKAEFSKQTLMAFYDAMDYVFRDGFGTGSQTAKKVLSSITGLLFKKE